MLTRKNTFMGCAMAAVLLPLSAQAQPKAGSLAESAAQDYLQQARHPHWSQPVRPGDADPLADLRTPTRQRAAGPKGAGPMLTVWGSTIAAQAGDTVELFAELSEGTPDSTDPLVALGLQKSKTAATGISAELLSETLGSVGQVVYRDDGQGADRKAGDGVYSASVTLPASQQPALGTADLITVKVTAALANGEKRVALGGYQYSTPAARLTGNYREALKDGSLVLSAEVEVLAEGRFHLTGTLGDLAGVPIVSAQQAQVLSPGTHWMDLSYYGLAFHDRAASGPFKLATASLATVTQMPNAMGPVLLNSFTTKAYELASFTSKPFNDPLLIDAARRLQLDAVK